LIGAQRGGRQQSGDSFWLSETAGGGNSPAQWALLDKLSHIFWPSHRAKVRRQRDFQKFLVTFFSKSFSYRQGSGLDRPEPSRLTSALEISAPPDRLLRLQR
jgi:hypothetical protein